MRYYDDFTLEELSYFIEAAFTITETYTEGFNTLCKEYNDRCFVRNCILDAVESLDPEPI